MAHSGEAGAAVTDTSEVAEQRYLERLRATSPRARLAIALRLSDRARNATMADLRRQLPQATGDQLALAFIRRVYGEEVGARFQERQRSR
jgi:hypothetical protein